MQEIYFQKCSKSKVDIWLWGGPILRLFFYFAKFSQAGFSSGQIMDPFWSPDPPLFFCLVHFVCSNPHSGKVWLSSFLCQIFFFFFSSDISCSFDKNITPLWSYCNWAYIHFYQESLSLKKVNDDWYDIPHSHPCIKDIFFINC